MNPQDALNQALQRHQSGDIAGAEAAYREILAQNPTHAEALHLIGVAEYQTGRLDDAAKSIQAAIAVNPSEASYFCNLGLIFTAIRALPQACAAFEHCLRMDPLAFEAFFNLGNVWRDMGRPGDALAAYQRCLQLQPNHIGSLNNMASVLRTVGRLDESASVSRHLLSITPRNVAAYNNLGNSLGEQGKLDESLECFRHALLIQPDHPQALSNLANGLLAQGKSKEALAHYDRALAIAANLSIASNRLFSLQFNPDFDANSILREARGFNEQYAGSFETTKSTPPARREGRLRIGYLSPNFRLHVARFFTAPLLSNHDRNRFEIFCYSDTTCPDSATGQFKSFADHWRDTASLDAATLADLIRKDEIDILVDLTMHMAHGRPLVFAAKPAPVQIAWLAYPGTTGLTAMDWRLTDPILDPPGQYDDCYSEKSHRLPETFLCFDPNALGETTPEPSPPPSIQNGFITFGCLNGFIKINEEQLQLWSRVLHAVPNSRLRLLAQPGETRRWAAEQFARSGIAPDRIDFVAYQPRNSYLAEYNRIDIALDTLPYNGETTTLDALWMAVPVITRVGRTVAGRAGWSLLSNLQLTELAAHSDDEFVQIAATLAADAPHLAELRRALRPRMAASPLTDGPRFAENVEVAFLEFARLNLQQV